jgi:hypothetical protein
VEARLSRSPILVAWALAPVLLAGARPSAAVPSAANSTIPSHVLLVGRVGDLADTTAGAFSVVVRDAANTPVAAKVVELRLINCPGARLSSQSYVAATTIRCDTHGVLQTTSLHGEVRMTAVGAGTPGVASATGPCALVVASNVQLGTVTVAYLDLDGDGGLGAGDLSLWLGDYSSGEPRNRSDYDGDGALSAGDLSVWLGIFAAGHSDESAATYCP